MFTLMNHIELFAGCGGLSLGLETAGFKLLMANELSPMASESFAYNILGTDLRNKKNIDKVFWISSQYPKDRMDERLIENPLDATGLHSNHFSDLEIKKHNNEELKRSLWVGSITDLNNMLSKKGSPLSSILKNGFGDGSVDLVSGGPPCQSFSMVGLRDHSNNRNKLPWEFAKFVESVQPKIVLLENVSGILRPFRLGDKKVHAWFEVAKTFAKVGYIPLCLHVNAKYIGAPQNRPRFLMLALRQDIYRGVKNSSADQELLNALLPSEQLFNKIQKGINPSFGCIKYFDIEKDKTLFAGNTLSPLFTHPKPKWVNVKEAIDDLHKDDDNTGSYVNYINRKFYNKSKLPLNKWLNHELRKNGHVVRARFRLYQVASKLEKEISQEIINHIRSRGSNNISQKAIKLLQQHWLLGEDGKRNDNIGSSDLRLLLEKLYSSKHSQTVLNANKPAPTVLGSPDDTGHYHESEATQRTLTVRELARIQSFPDWYEIKSKVTTGGIRRRFEVPQYTQIGNSVPPLLGLALGLVCSKILNGHEH